MGRRPGSPRPEATAGVDTGEWHGAELERLGAATHIPCHWTLLFFRTSAVKDSSFVEKMKKTVSFPSVLCSSQRVLPWWMLRGPQQKASCSGQARVGGNPGPAPLHIHFHLTKTPKLPRCCWDSHFGFLNVYFLNKPNCENRLS